MDGSPLVDENTLIRTALHRVAGSLPETPQRDRSEVKVVWITLSLGVLIGVVLSLLVYVSEFAPQKPEIRNDDKSTADHQQLAPGRSAHVSSTLTPQTTPDLPVAETQAEPGETTADPSPSPENSPAATPGEIARRSENDGPISTGSKQSGKQERAIIRLKDGAMMEVDAVWEDRQGVWYRRGGLVSFVEPDRVAEITEPLQPRQSPSDVVRP